MFQYDKIKKLKIFDNNNYDINKIIHDTGLLFSQNKKFNNMQLINFIRNDEYYNLEAYKKKVYKVLYHMNEIQINILQIFLNLE